MKTFYRLQDDGGRGVYKSTLADKILADAELLGNTTKSPHPTADEKLRANCEVLKLSANELNWNGEWRFGFTSIDALDNWFDLPVLSAILAAGIKLVIFHDVADEDIVEGDRQSVMRGTVHEKRTASGKVETITNINQFLKII